MTAPVRPSSAAEHVRIFDTTLRDGELASGFAFGLEQRLELARALSRLGVDVIEAGTPALGAEQARAVSAVCEAVGRSGVPAVRSGEPPIVCALSRADESDIHAAFATVRAAKYPRLHVYLATSAAQREHEPAALLERVRRSVTVARSLCADVEFTAFDASRTEPGFLYEVFGAALAAGATTLNVPDSVGHAVPAEFGQLVANVVAHTPGSERATISVHCHDDLGLAAANTLAGVQNGARQVEVTLNGIGTRAGNTALEQMALVFRAREATLGLRTHIDPSELVGASRLVSRLGKFPVSKGIQRFLAGETP
jgi:2-isopropylmalate synthase